jgi:hypothetical protein
VLSFPLLPVPLYTTFSAQQKKTALINKSALPELLLKITLAVHNHKNLHCQSQSYLTITMDEMLFAVSVAAAQQLINAVFFFSIYIA